MTVDPSLPEDYFAVTQSAHVGYKARLWKIVYENGKQVSKEQINSSYYAAEPRYVTKGGSAQEEETTDKPENTKSVKATKPPKKTATKEPKATKDPEPVATKAPVVTERPEETKEPAAEKEPDEAEHLPES